MKRHLAIIVAGLVLSACAPGMYHTRTGAAIGGGLGALMGQAIGRSTESTLVGAGVGTLIGSVLGSYEDQRVNDVEVYETGDSRVVYVDPSPTVHIVVPRYRVTVPSRWGHGHRPPPPRRPGIFAPPLVHRPPHPRIVAPQPIRRNYDRTPPGHRPPPPGLRHASPRVAPRPDPRRDRKSGHTPGPSHSPRLDGRHSPSLSLHSSGRSRGGRPTQGRGIQAVRRPSA